ncbi:MAG TPA: sigma-70 family RNA polymerase sigma factor [Phenylobacterium sp.]
MTNDFKAQLLAVTPALRGYALSLTGAAADADDLVQETLLRAWRSRDTYEACTNFKAWMFRILKNTRVSHVTRGRVSTVDFDSPAAANLGSAPQQEWSVQFAELLQALDGLPPIQREALLLVVGSGLSYEDAGFALGVPQGTVKSRVNRARTSLAQRFGSDEQPGQLSCWGGSGASTDPVALRQPRLAALSA